METSISMVSLLVSLDANEFRPRPVDATRAAVEIALEKGWVVGQKSRPTLQLPDQLRLTPSGEKAIEFYLK